MISENINITDLIQLLKSFTKVRDLFDRQKIKLVHIGGSVDLEMTDTFSDIDITIVYLAEPNAKGGFDKIILPNINGKHAHAFLVPTNFQCSSHHWEYPTKLDSILWACSNEFVAKLSEYLDQFKWFRFFLEYENCVARGILNWKSYPKELRYQPTKDIARFLDSYNKLTNTLSHDLIMKVKRHKKSPMTSAELHQIFDMIDEAMTYGQHHWYSSWKKDFAKLELELSKL